MLITLGTQRLNIYLGTVSLLYELIRGDSLVVGNQSQHTISHT